MEDSERISIIENDIKHIKKTMDRIEGKLDEQTNKFAGKWTEKFISAPIIAGIVALIGMVVSFIVGK